MWHEIFGARRIHLLRISRIEIMCRKEKQALDREGDTGSEFGWCDLMKYLIVA